MGIKTNLQIHSLTRLFIVLLWKVAISFNMASVPWFQILLWSSNYGRLNNKDQESGEERNTERWAWSFPVKCLLILPEVMRSWAVRSAASLGHSGKCKRIRIVEESFLEGGGEQGWEEAMLFFLTLMLVIQVFTLP